MPTQPIRNVALVGTGGRGLMYNRAVTERPGMRIAALLDRNPGRMAFHNSQIRAAGSDPAATYEPDDFEAMVSQNDIDTLVVTSMDVTHDTYIVAGLEAGLNVITEKPMTTDGPRARRILDTVERTGNHPTVTFNYRYNPVHERFATLLSEGAIGEIVSVHFEWTLNTRHGTDYFHRWHRNKDNCGGLMVHKASHHFDLVNWWISQRPQTVMAFGQKAFYGRENGTRLGLRREYERATGSPEAATDPYAIDLAADPRNREMYLDAEKYDGYQRDQNVFGDGITSEDDMAVLVRYDRGATMSYHLTAYSPWEGYRVMINGTGGRLELDVVESEWTVPPSGSTAETALHGEAAAPNAGGAQILLRRLWEPPAVVEVPFDHAGHGGGDARLLNDLFGRVDGAPVDSSASDASRLRANEVDGAMAMAVGAAANVAFETGQPVQVEDLLGGPVN